MRALCLLAASLVALSCSAGPGETTEAPSAPDDTETPAEPEADEAHTLAGLPASPWAVPCSPSCSLAWPSASTGAVQLGGMPCAHLTTESSCSSAPAGWLYSPVPACGESALWLEGCFWTGSACMHGAFWESTQACLP